MKLIDGELVQESFSTMVKNAVVECGYLAVGFIAFVGIVIPIFQF